MEARGFLAQVEKVRELLLQGKYDDARDSCSQLNRELGDTCGSSCRLVEILTLRHQFTPPLTPDAAMRELALVDSLTGGPEGWSTLTGTPAAGRLHLLRASLLTSMGRLEEAEEELHRATDESLAADDLPTYVATQLKLAHLQFAAHRQTSALNLLHTARSQLPRLTTSRRLPLHATLLLIHSQAIDPFQGEEELEKLTLQVRARKYNGLLPYLRLVRATLALTRFDFQLAAEHSDPDRLHLTEHPDRAHLAQISAAMGAFLAFHRCEPEESDRLLAEAQRLSRLSPPLPGTRMLLLYTRAMGLVEQGRPDQARQLVLQHLRPRWHDATHVLNTLLLIIAARVELASQNDPSAHRYLDLASYQVRLSRHPVLMASIELIRAELELRRNYHLSAKQHLIACRRLCREAGIRYHLPARASLVEAEIARRNEHSLNLSRCLSLAEAHLQPEADRRTAEEFERLAAELARLTQPKIV